MGREVHIKIKEREKEPSMSIQKKSLISALKTTKKANIAKEDLSSTSAAPQGAKDLQAGRNFQGAKVRLQAGKTNLQAGKTHLQAGKTHLQGGKTNLQAGKTHLQGGKTNLQAGKTHLQGGKLSLQGGKR
jgi:hypothetical protein